MENQFTQPGSLLYKGRPLVRSGDTLYYGNMADKYVAVLKILTETELQGEQVPSKVGVEIWATDEKLLPKDRMVRKTEKNTFYEAINIASIWLERQLAESK